MIIWTVLRNIVIDSSIVTPNNIRIRTRYKGTDYSQHKFSQEIEDIKRKKIMFRKKLQETRNSLGFQQNQFAGADLSMNFIPKDNFSPESGGRVKSRTAMEEMRRQGTIKL